MTEQQEFGAEREHLAGPVVSLLEVNSKKEMSNHSSLILSYSGKF